MSEEWLLHDLFVVPDYDRGEVRVSFTAPRGSSQIKWEVLRGESAAASELSPGGPTTFTAE